VSEEVAAHERSLLDGVTRDDRVDITYTEALLATATRVK
jgi:hypothetical protein